MIDLDELYQAVPIGKENAETSRQIWKRFGVWSANGIRPNLIALAASGRIVRIRRHMPDGGMVYCFYRRPGD
jgi:hypothetical protein